MKGYGNSVSSCVRVILAAILLAPFGSGAAGAPQDASNRGRENDAPIAVRPMSDEELAAEFAKLAEAITPEKLAADPVETLSGPFPPLRAFVSRTLSRNLTQDQERKIMAYLTDLQRRYPEAATQGKRNSLETQIYRFQNLRIGKIAPEIAGKDYAGVDFKLSDYRGKVVVLYFTGHWCGPCRTEYPFQRQMVDEFKDAPFALLTVNSDELDTAKQAKTENDLKYRSWTDGSIEGPITMKWGVHAFPTIYLIDAEGRIRFKGPRKEDTVRAAKQLLGELGEASEPEPAVADAMDAFRMLPAAKNGPVDVRIGADSTAVEPGRPFRVGLLYRMAADWHIYHQKAGGVGLPTTIQWTLPAGFTVGDTIWPEPAKVMDPALEEWSYIYEDEVLISAIVTPPADLDPNQVFVITARTEWQSCQTGGVCIPGQAEMSIDLKPGPAAPSPLEPAFGHFDNAPRVPGGLASPIRLKAGGEYIDVNTGHAAPIRYDFDRDGKLDLLVGEFGKEPWIDESGTPKKGYVEARLRIYRNLGTDAAPEYGGFEWLMADGRPAAIPMTCCNSFGAQFVDFDGDGLDDILVGGYDGEVWLFDGIGGGEFAARRRLASMTGEPIDGGYCTTVEAHDLDSDGDLDLIVGTRVDGVFFLMNEGTRTEPRYAASPSKLMSTDGKQIKPRLGGNNAHLADWDGDGVKDLIVGSEYGDVYWYKNLGRTDRPSFGPEQLLFDCDLFGGSGGENPDAPGGRPKMFVTDYNMDGLPDLLLGDYGKGKGSHGWVWLYLREAADGLPQ